MSDAMSEPRTVAGRAAVSSSRPDERRALMAAVVAVEDEARAPLLEVLRDAREVLDRLAVHETTDPQLAQEAADLEGRIASEVE